MRDANLPEGLAQLESDLRERIERLPRQPGVYLLKDRDEAIIYVGKAKNLNTRVRSYFRRGGDTRAFVALLVELLGDVQTIVTRNEKEALLLENNLIKQHRPRFNVMLRDDKNYLVLRLDPQADYPRLEVTRQIGKDQARYFGPYHSASSCRETLRVVNRHFQLRTCTDRTMHSRTRPCLQYQIQRCPAPCVFEVDREQYSRQVDDVSLFLRGRQDELLAALMERMHEAAEALNFEHAARLRDQMAAIRRSLLGQQAVGDDLVDQDVFGFHREGDAVDVVVLNLRGGKLLGQQPFSFSKQEFPDAELLSSFITQYYEQNQSIPEQVLLPLAIEDAGVTANWLSELRGRRVQLLLPKRGKKRQLLQLALRNALSNFRSRRSQDADSEAALAQLQQRLHLRRLPRHIECYDNSNIGGRLMVGSMVVLRNGQPDKASYRRFKIQYEQTRVADDFSAMYQVLARRLRRAKRQSQGWELPDLIVVDGGKGQLSVAQAALKDADLPNESLPDLVALAKERRDADDDDGSERARSEWRRPDRVFLPGVKDPIRLRPNTAALFLLSRARDEAHRFAITHHKSLRRKKTLRSELDDIPGVGPTLRGRLLRRFGSIKRIRQASPQQLSAVEGISEKAARSILDHLGQSAAEPDRELAPKQSGEASEQSDSGQARR